MAALVIKVEFDPELIKAISSNSLAIGVCDYAWLSDKDDNTTKEFFKKTKLFACGVLSLTFSRLNITLSQWPWGPLTAPLRPF